MHHILSRVSGFVEHFVIFRINWFGIPRDSSEVLHKREIVPSSPKTSDSLIMIQDFFGNTRSFPQVFEEIINIVKILGKILAIKLVCKILAKF